VYNYAAMVSNRLKTEQLSEHAFRMVDDSRAIADDYGDYSSDESRLASFPPLSLAFPESIPELASVMAQHHAQRRAVVVSGARTGVVGGAVVAVEGAHVVSTERMTGVQQVGQDDDGQHYVRVLAGTSLTDLTSYLAEHHPELVFPVDPTESWASLGGMVSTNASGTRSLRYGATREWVRALKVVLANGSLLSLRRGEVRADGGQLWLDDGGQARELVAPAIDKPRAKHAIGYSYGPEIDAIDLFIGAEGTLGVIGEVELGLVRRPAASLYLLQFFPQDESAFAFVDWLRAEQSLRPAAIEYFDDHSLALLAERVPASRSRFVGLIDSDCRAAIYAELELDSESALEQTLEAVCEQIEAVGASLDRSVVSTEEADWRALKLFRHALPEQINATIAERKRSIPLLHKLSTDMAVPDEHLRAIHAYYRETLQSNELEHFIFGHIGNNHFHVNIVPRDAEQLELAKRLYRQVGVKVRELGGAVAAEHGIGRIKRSFLEIQYSPEQLDVMQRIKRFFDPEGRLNPGVLLD
jgi:D-lactate dehydrogenase (cytochrome)